MEVYHLFEEVEAVVANGRVGEVGDGRGSGPGDDADEDDAGHDGALDAVHHEEDSQDAAAEDANPHGRVTHLIPAGACAIFQLIGRRATGKLEWSVGGANNESQTLAVGETDEGQEEADADTGSHLDGVRDGPSKPLSHTEKGKAQEDEAFDEDGSQGNPVRNRTSAVEANNGISEVGIQPHSRSKTDRQVGQEAHEEAGKGRDGGGGSDGVALDGLDTQGVFVVVVASRVRWSSVADAGTAGIRDDGGVDGEDVGHGEEGGHAAADLGEEQGSLSFLGL